MLHYSVERKNLMEKSSNKLVDLSVAFAVEILNLVKYLKEQRETIICNQIGRAGTGADIARAIVYLASDNSSFVTGSDMAVDGARPFISQW